MKKIKKLKTTIPEDWGGMPEFVQNKKTPHAQLIVRFDNEEDLQEFSKLIGQTLNRKSKSIWHPKLVRGLTANKRYINGN